MLKVDRVSYTYDTAKVLKEVSLNIMDGEILCLLGPSGCGKTTLLRVIAGLETKYTGNIWVQGQDIREVPVNKRDFGLMFQDFALFPHMSVAQNVAYGLKRKQSNTTAIEKKVEQMLSRVGLSGLEKRDVNQLSGGQKQRVALARSLAPNPRLLMLDEPLGSLDALLRDQLIVELRDIIKSLGLTAIYVTHDQKEAYAIADRVAVMNVGRIEQVDSPSSLYFRPRTSFIARFLGLSNIFAVQDVQDIIGDQLEIQSEFILIHPSGIRLTDEVKPTEIRLDGEILQKIFRGEMYSIVMQVTPSISLRWTTPQTEFEIGDHVNVSVQKDHVLHLD